MPDINLFLSNNILSIVVLFSVILVFLLAVSIIALVEVKKLKKRYETFTGGSKRHNYTLETQLSDYHNAAKVMEERYNNLAEMISDIDKNMEKCVQKVGVVRYNPFDEVGGNLSYAIALLDSKNNGVVLNGIHNRTGSFTYAKPIELGVSEYALSEEENRALEIALNEGYTPENRQRILNEMNELLPQACATAEKADNQEQKEYEKEPAKEMEKDVVVSSSAQLSADLAALLNSVDNSVQNTPGS